MKFYAIPPNKHLNLMDNGDCYFALCHHYANDKKYKQHFLNIRKNNPNAFITLDNAAAEHSLVTEETLIEAVAELKPNEVIAPDVLFDKNSTLRNFYSFIEKMEKHKLFSHTSIFACPQGSTKEEWLECYYEMSISLFTSCIGLSKIAVPYCWNKAEGDKMIGISRNQCIQELFDKKWLFKPIHLLGMGEHTEFDYYLENKIPNIRSSDSCYTILAAINGIDFSSGRTERIPTTNAYFNKSLIEREIALAKKNIVYLKNKYKDV